MRYLSTKQNYHSPKENPTLWNYGPFRCPTLPTNSHGPNHGTSPQKWKRHHPYHRRSWLLTSGGLLAMLNKYHGTRHRPTLFGTCLLMVWSTKEDDQQQGPQIHISLWKSTPIQTGHHSKPFHHF